MRFKKITSTTTKLSYDGKLYCYYLDIVDIFGCQNEWYFQHKEHFFKIELSDADSEELSRRYKMVQFKITGTEPVGVFTDWLLNKLNKRR